jgi:outer membrane protein OmpA-like peptidoglycan-associated protein/tetratricopeptide (TPR) repeat protein
MKKSLLIIFCFVSFNVCAQKKEADKNFFQLEYSDAIPLYKKYLKKNPSDYDANKKLALSYQYTNQTASSIDVYKTIVGNKDAVPQDWYDLVQLLRIKGAMKEAKDFALQYQSKENSEKAQNLLNAIDMYDELMSTQNDYTVVNKTSQYTQSVFTTIPYKNGFIVTSPAVGKAKSAWTGNGYTKLFTTDASFSPLKPFADEIMTKYADGISTFSSDGNTIYFTSTNKELLKETNINRRKLQISSAKLENEKWLSTEYFQYNDSSYNVAHPALIQDGKVLVFSSDRPGGKGGMDLYSCNLNENNTWDAPVNISQLNTSGNEIFPSFNSDGDLSFSSNGLLGLGGLDIFNSKFDGKTFSAPENVKAPINSTYDDFSLTSFNDFESGYFSTNRFESTASDDIAFFTRKIAEVVKPTVKTLIKIAVVDKYTSTPLPYVLVSIKDSKNNVIQTGMTDPDGFLLVEDIPADDYRVQGVVNDITTSIAQISKDEFENELVEKTVNHNDPRFTMSGLVINSDTGQPVEGVTVACDNTTFNRSNSIITKADGKFFFQLEQASDFKVTGEKKGWLSSESGEETTKGLDRSKELYVKIKLNIQQPTVNKKIKLDKILYDYDKCNIKPIAAEELDRLVKLMNDYAGMIIELSSHTDSRGSSAYNETLSQCRADAAVAYILSKNITKNRIVAKGYGENKLLNECSDGVTCSEEKHQENRRTEFQIVACPSCPPQSN